MKSLALAVATLVSLAAPAQALEPGQKLEVQLQAFTTHRDGDAWGPSTSSASAGTHVAEGERGLAYVALGTLDSSTQQRNDLCSSSCGGTSDLASAARVREEQLASASDVWLATYEALPSPIGRVALELSWEHWTRAGSGEARRVGGDVRRIVMDEGQRSVLDFLALDPALPATCASNVEIAVTARVKEDPELAGTTLAYDVWYEHVDREGVATRRRAQVTARQGESVPVEFEPLRFPIAGATMADGRAIESVLEGSGTVLGRVQEDGHIRVRLTARRWTGVAPARTPRAGGIGGGGEMTFDVKPGETVRLTIPPPGGTTGINRTGNGGRVVDYGTSSPGGRSLAGAEPSSREDVFDIDNAAFYQGSRDSLILTVRTQQ